MGNSQSGGASSVQREVHPGARDRANSRLDRIVYTRKDLRQPFFEIWKQGISEAIGMKFASATYKLSTATVHIDANEVPDKFYWNQLQLVVHSASNLKKADSAIFGGKSDPYVMMEALDETGAVIFKRITPFLPNTLNPAWEWDLTSTWGSESKKQTPVIHTLIFHVKDNDGGMKDTYLGRVTLKRGSKGFKDCECKEFQLKPKPSMGPADARTITGSLYITMRMKKETLDAKQMRVHCRKLEKSWHRQIFGAQSRARAFSDATMIAARGHALPGAGMMRQPTTFNNRLAVPGLSFEMSKKGKKDKKKNKKKNKKKKKKMKNKKASKSKKKQSQRGSDSSGDGTDTDSSSDSSSDDADQDANHRHRPVSKTVVTLDLNRERKHNTRATDTLGPSSSSSSSSSQGRKRFATAGASPSSLPPPYLSTPSSISRVRTHTSALPTSSTPRSESSSRSRASSSKGRSTKGKMKRAMTVSSGASASSSPFAAHTKKTGGLPPRTPLSVNRSLTFAHSDDSSDSSDTDSDSSDVAKDKRRSKAGRKSKEKKKKRSEEGRSRSKKGKSKKKSRK